MRRYSKALVTFQAPASSAKRCEVGCTSSIGVSPWAVEVPRGPKGIDYDRVLTAFRAKRVNPELLSGFAALVKEDELHPFFRRGTVLSHRGFDEVIDHVGSGKQVFLYTGRGPSSQQMHLGHSIPFLLTKYLQDLLGCPIVVQITDDEKYLFRNVAFDSDDLIRSNIKDIIAFGFDPKRTFIFRNTQYMGTLYPTVLQLQRLLTLNASKKTFGFSDNDCVGKAAFPAIQAAAAFRSSFPRVLPPQSREGHTSDMMCLIPCAIDQDPFFVLARTLASRMMADSGAVVSCQQPQKAIRKPHRPAVLHTKFVPALKGTELKMSSSAEQNGVILMSDPPSTVQKKIAKAFSGGSGTLEDMKLKGVNLDVDVAFQLLSMFSPSDEEVGRVGLQYQSGEVNSAAVKSLAARVISDGVLRQWQQRRATVTDEEVDLLCSERDICYV